jgi:3-dehydroquinate dehydratase II
MASVLLLSGPNLNHFGERQPEIYGTTTLAELVEDTEKSLAAAGHTCEHIQSNHEGALVDAVQGARGRCAAIIVNAAALTHYSYALADALACFDGVKVELHVSNPAGREEWRRASVVAPVVTATIAGLGRHGYRLAAEAVIALLEERGK